MTHTDTDIAEILQRFEEQFTSIAPDYINHWKHVPYPSDIKGFITRECLALKKKWEREHFDNQ